LINADWISVKIDAVDEGIWRDLNRPVHGISLLEIMEGVNIFASAYRGKLCSETMIVQDYNDSLQHLEQLASFIAGLNPFKAFLSVPMRPPSVKNTEPVSEAKLTEALKIFRNAGITTEILADFEGTDIGFTGNIYEDIFNITAVHPLREDSLLELLEREKADIKIIDSLIREGLIRKINFKGQKFYIRKYHF
jgi:wyosine [tRNA(Phe)-imidazoG37] synthetase (radical SAM superfamily)